MLNPIKSFLHRLGGQYNAKLCKAEYRDQAASRKNERCIEYRFVFECLTEFRPDSVLDIGTGQTALPSLVRSCGFLTTAIDNIVDYWPKGMVNRHFHVIQDDINKPLLKEKFDVVLCISVLEHIKTFDQAVAGMFSLLNPGGHLILTFPYSEHKYIEDCYQLPGSSYGQGSAYVCQSYSRAQIQNWLTKNNAGIVKQEFWEFFSGDYWTVGEVLKFPRKVGKEDRHHLTCLALKKAP